MKEAAKRLVLAAGRPVKCEVCGAVLFTAVPIIWKGRVKLVGAESALVRAEFATMNELVFRHVDPAECRGTEGARA